MSEAVASAATGYDWMMPVLLCIVVALLLIAVWRMHRRSAAIRQLRLLVQAAGEGRHEFSATAQGTRGFPALARDIGALCAAIAHRTRVEAERFHARELAHEQQLAQQARLEAEAAHARQLQAKEQRLRELEQAHQAALRQHHQQSQREREQTTRHEQLLQARDQERVTRERQRRQLAEDFEWQVAGILEQVQGAVQQLRANAGQMAQLAGDSARRSNEAAGMASRTDETAAQVSHASAALSDSAQRMRGQAQKSCDGAGSAVAEAADAATAINALFEATRQIGSIAGIISEITRQTSLLSINARIEAARAGEAGRGFAVVASEVMELAARTRKATDRIDEQIRQVTDAAQRSADVLGRLGQRIGELGDSAGTILETAELQCRSTLDISDRMGQISHSTRTVSAGIQAAQGAASAARQRCGEVLAAAERMDEQTRRMQEQVARFVLDIQDAGLRHNPAPHADGPEAAPCQVFPRAAAG